MADAHLLLRAQMGQDKRDPFSSTDNARIPARAHRRRSRRSLRVAVSPDLGCAPIDRAIAEIFKARVGTFRHAFQEVQERAPDFGPVHDIFEVHRCVQFVAAHRERLEKSRDLLDRNVIDNTERGLKLSLGDVSRAHVEQTKLYKRFLAFFKDVDVLICPAASVSPFPHAQLFVEEINGEKMPTYMRWLAITYAPTVALACAAAVPCGVDHLGMPFGIQVIGPNGSDARVLEVAHALEQVLAAEQGNGAACADLASSPSTPLSPYGERAGGEGRKTRSHLALGASVPPTRAPRRLPPRGRARETARSRRPTHPTRRTHPHWSRAPARCRPASRRWRR